MVAGVFVLLLLLWYVVGEWLQEILGLD